MEKQITAADGSTAELKQHDRHAYSKELATAITEPLNLERIFEQLPKTERTLLKRYKSYSFRIANDRGTPCDWYIYENGLPVAVVTYYRGSKLCMWLISTEPETDEFELTANAN